MSAIARAVVGGVEQQGRVDGGEFVTDGGLRLPLTGSTRLPPVRPSKVLGIGLNHGDRAEPAFMYIKPPSSVIGSGTPVVLPEGQEELLIEAELGIVIGTRCRNVGLDEASAYILGYTCGNDIAAPGMVDGTDHGQWTAAKGADTFCPLGPVVRTDLDPSDLRITCRVNGELVQDGTAGWYRFGPAQLVSWLSRTCTLEPGDVVLMGSVPDPPYVRAGDEMEIEIEGIGSILNRVETEGAGDD